MKIESDTHYFNVAADVVLRTSITQAMFAELAQMQAFEHMQAVRLVADAYELHAYFTINPDSVYAAFVADWMGWVKGMGCIVKGGALGGDYKAYDPKGRYCGRLSLSDGRATIINWRS